MWLPPSVSRSFYSMIVAVVSLLMDHQPFQLSFSVFPQSWPVYLGQTIHSSPLGVVCNRLAVQINFYTSKSVNLTCPPNPSKGTDTSHKLQFRLSTWSRSQFLSLKAKQFSPEVDVNPWWTSPNPSAPTGTLHLWAVHSRDAFAALPCPNLERWRPTRCACRHTLDSCRDRFISCLYICMYIYIYCLCIIYIVCILYIICIVFM